MADQQHASRPPRDSHDLSLSLRDITRDSLVNNMLLSLDKLSLGNTGPAFGLTSSAFDERPWTNDPVTQGRTTNGYAGGQRHQYSYSSDLDAADDSSRHSSQTSRGRRSNSGSNFQSGFTRLNSLKETTHRVQPGPSRGLHSRGGRGSNKSSSSTSIDVGYPPSSGNQHWARGNAGLGRSASFDHGPSLVQKSQQLNPPLMSPFQIDFPSSFTSDDFSAAPTPTVPGGPRRVPSSILIPPPPPEPKEPLTLLRKRSTSRSLKSSAGRSMRGTTLQQQVAPAMPMPDLEFDSAPAPSVGYGKSKAEAHAGPAGGAPAQAKERPGFFRRVFGGGSSKAPSPLATNGPPELQPSSSFTPPLPPPADRLERPASKKTQQPNPGQPKPVTAPPSRDAVSSHSTHPVLQKKTSSFFRRRKKSVADEPLPLSVSGDAPPVPSVPDSHTQTDKDSDFAVQPSPVSSLRKVMGPYLRDGPGGSGTRTAQTSPLSDVTNMAPAQGEDVETKGGYKREFSPDYEPSPNAKIRAVPSESDHEYIRRSESPPLHPSQRPGKRFERRNNSFLDLDGASDNDDDLPALHSKQNSNKNNTKENGNSSGPGSSPVSHKHRDPNGTIRPRKKVPFTLEQTDTDDEPNRPNLSLPIEGARSTSFASGSTETGYKTAPSAPPSVRIESTNEPSPKVLGTLESMQSKSLDEPEFIIGEPTEDDRQKAQKIYDGVEDFIQKDKAAAWMGEEGPVRQRTLHAYIQLYSFTDLSVADALRKVCSRLVLRAETQQVDRILVAFSKRWCECNPNHGFKSVDVIHTICYSIMLLNTDLHLADIEQKMTRSQFVKNTLTTITQAALESVPDAFDRPSILPEKNQMLGNDTKSSIEQDRKTFRNSFRPPPRVDNHGSDNYDDCGPLVRMTFNGSRRAWEEQVEMVLKCTYASIRDDRLPLFGAEPERHLNNVQSHSSLSVIGMLKRTPSVLSKAPSESHISLRGRIADNNRNAAPRWTSKSRSRPGMGRNGFSSSRTSFEDSNSIWSPAMSSATWSRYSLGRTQGSMSQDSFGSAMNRGDYQQSIGFANALSQAIIRDEDAGAPDGASILSSDVPPPTQILEDESLELAGPPWVKEGMVMHKHHLDGVGKRARDRNWTEVFAVIQKGQMSLFSFNSSKSMRQKNRSRNAGKTNAPVGGGNWQDNAINMGTFSLRLTLASGLPSPGYSRTRPYVWALSLPTGAVHLFQGGTPEIIREFVQTANYWSARLSTHPLVGGISNVEYGWSEAIVNNALVNAINESGIGLTNGVKNAQAASNANHHARKSSAHSGRSFRSSSLDHGSGPFTNNGGRGKLPGDRIHISEWTPPTQSMRPCNLLELDQLQTLANYVKSIEEELQTHNQLRSPMLLAFTPRSHNAGKAMANWERKSAYLLREIVKFRTYVDSLQHAETRKVEIYNERDLARRAARGELSDGEMEVSGAEEGDETLRP